MNHLSTPAPHEREAVLFALALERPVAESPAFLRAVCGEDAALRQRLEALQEAHDQPDERLSDRAGRPTVPATAETQVDDGPPDEAVGQTLGRYKMLERVGEGGCGVVY